jgi:hypothetical protein
MLIGAADQEIPRASRWHRPRSSSLRRHASYCRLPREFIGAARKSPLGEPVLDISDPVHDPAPPQPDEGRPAAGRTPSLSGPGRNQIALTKPFFVDVFGGSAVITAMLLLNVAN